MTRRDAGWAFVGFGFAAFLLTGNPLALLVEVLGGVLVLAR